MDQESEWVPEEGCHVKLAASRSLCSTPLLKEMLQTLGIEQPSLK